MKERAFFFIEDYSVSKGSLRIEKKKVTRAHKVKLQTNNIRSLSTLTKEFSPEIRFRF